MARRYDIAIIGAGTAGLSALSEVRKATDNFVIINDGPYGTTCARRGCMPSKTLIEYANIFHTRHALERLGVQGATALRLDGAGIMARMRALRDDFAASAAQQTADLGQRNIQGRARFVDPHTLAVNGQTLEAEASIIATGSHPIIPATWPALGERVVGSDDFFEWRDLPASVAVVGMGGVGLELAQALSRLGVEVYGFQASNNVIGGLSDEAVSAAALAILQQEFPIFMGAAAELAAEGEGVAVRGSGGAVVVDKVLAAVGRRPNLDDLGLERLGLSQDEQGRLPFNRHTMQLGELPVYIAGDVNGCVPLLHEAADEGHIAARNALQRGQLPFKRRTPLMIVFADPHIAVVGHSLASLAPFEPVIGQADFSGQGRLRMSGRDQGLLRLYAEPGSGRLLGAEMCVPEGEHLAHLLAWAMDRDQSVHDLLRMPFYHPVVEEGLRSALRDTRAQLLGESTAPPELTLYHRLPCAAADG